MSFSKRRSFRRTLQVESLEQRRAMAIDISVQSPTVSSFTGNAEVTGLGTQVSDQDAVVHNIDVTGSRHVIKEIDGQLYSFQGATVFQTDTSTGTTQSFPLTPLPGTSGVEVRDIQKVNGALLIVGGSLTGNAAATKRTIATQWDENGQPTRLGPAGTLGIANVIHPDGLIAGFYEKQSLQFTPWIHTSQGDFDLPATPRPSNEQTVTGLSQSGYYLVGYENGSPLVWQASDQPEVGAYELMFSPESSLQYPEDAVVDQSGRKYQVVEDAFGSVYIFGQYGLPVLDGQGQFVRLEPHAAMWAIDGSRLFDFGADTDMLGVVGLGNSFAVAHRNSISLLEQQTVTRFPLDDLLPAGTLEGTTRTIVDGGLISIGQPDAPRLGVNFVEVGATNKSKIALVPLKSPTRLDIDAESDGIFESSFDDFEMQFPSFFPQHYGNRQLTARVVYSDGSIGTATADYQSLPFGTLDGFDGLELLFGGTADDDVATLTQLGGSNYRAEVGTESNQFDLIEEISVRLGAGNDRLNLRGNTAIDLSRLAGVELIDAIDSTTQTISGIDGSNVALQVGNGNTMTIRADAQDILELQGVWGVGKPEVVNGQAAVKLFDDNASVQLVRGRYHNVVMPLDPTFDGFVSPRDALLIINYINQVSGGLTPSIEAYLDVNDNGSISALDVLLVINYLNNGSGEGEASTLVGAGIDWNGSERSPSVNDPDSGSRSEELDGALFASPVGASGATAPVGSSTVAAPVGRSPIDAEELDSPPSGRKRKLLVR